ncbi:hypothetical protein B0H10DRAFT_57905 [Mycena sp. CBHHK59/15]|nr:hypothetical protein B0H10DRAFT_57905 [Mycena sp. CBHHK59/15]
MQCKFLVAFVVSCLALTVSAAPAAEMAAVARAPVSRPCFPINNLLAYHRLDEGTRVADGGGTRARARCGARLHSLHLCLINRSSFRLYPHIPLAVQSQTRASCGVLGFAVSSPAARSENGDGGGPFVDSVMEGEMASDCSAFLKKSAPSCGFVRCHCVTL